MWINRWYSYLGLGNFNRCHLAKSWQACCEFYHLFSFILSSHPTKPCLETVKRIQSYWILSVSFWTRTCCLSNSPSWKILAQLLQACSWDTDNNTTLHHRQTVTRSTFIPCPICWGIWKYLLSAAHGPNALLSTMYSHTPSHMSGSHSHWSRYLWHPIYNGTINRRFWPRYSTTFKSVWESLPNCSPQITG